MVPYIGQPTFPRVGSQLNPDTIGGTLPSTAGDDCNVMVTKAQLLWAKGLDVSRATIRSLMGAPTGGTSSSMVMTVLNHFSAAPVRLADFNALEAALKDPKQLVSIAWNNGWINDNYPEFSGDRNFRGGHRVALYGWEQLWQDGPVFNVLLDPAANGRKRDGILLAKQPECIRANIVQNAMVAFGSFSAIAVSQ